MVKTRFAADSESKMPVKDTSKDEPREEVDSACMSGKDNSDFSSKTPKVWSRELRNRFVISSEKRSIRFTNDVVRSGRGLRSCRMALKSRQHFSLSQSDDDDDDRIFSACGPSKRLKHRMSKRHMHSDRSGVSSPDKDENPSTRLPYLRRKRISDIAGAGIRRSTRQRKLKYENYSDSWIVGAQTLVGYPMYGNSYASKGGRLGPLKEEVEGEEGEDEDDEDDDEKEGGDETEGDSEEADEEEEEEPKTISLQSHGVKVENNVINGQDEMPDDGAFEDMYSRVKRPRPTRRDIFQVQPRETRKRKSVRSSSSDESSSEERRPTLRERKLGVVESRKYCLRKTKPTVDRFVPEVAESRRESRALREAFHKSVRRRRRRRRASSSSSSNSSDNSDRRFDCKKPKARSRCLTSVGQETVADRSLKNNRTDGIGANVGRLADLDPVTLDTSIRFSHVGGLEDHVRCLQEMVVFPMLYSEVFQKFHITPPKGVLFYGPPGTGKTLIARALANECSQGDHKVSFFMRKGADCLSKWVGESERQLRLLFEQAHHSRPSIIFFDEIDGLAPVRSAKQDQIHASIVSTLLALMDGLDDRGDIVVIGATNRIDAIDPALRRPGRFDRELLFPLPAIKERKEILRIHVSKWEKPPPPPLLNRLAEMTVGFCGSDLRALCTEAVIHGLRRKYPQIYKSSQKLLLDPDCVQVEKVDFDAAKKSIVPSSYRSAPAIACELPVYLHPLLNRPLTELTSRLNFSFPSGFQKCTKIVQMTKSHRLLIVGQKSSGKKSCTLTHISAALLYAMEQCPVHTIDLATLFCQSSRSAEEACIQIFNEARRSVPSIIYVPKVSEWWDIVGNTVQVVFSTQLAQMNSLPILLLATAYDPLPSQLQNMFSLFRDEVYTIQRANEKEREDFFRPLILKRALLPPRLLKSKVPIPELPLAPPPAPPKLTEQQLQHIYNDEENTLRELRIFLRQICSKLARNRQFFMFSKPVDVNEVPDYLSIIKEPMDLETMMTKIDLHKFTCAQDFLDDIDLLCRNALEYNPDRDPADKLIRHRACFLRDTAYALIKAEMDSDFEEQCRGIRDARTKRAASPDRFVPDFVWTAANLPPNMTSTPMPSSSGVGTTLDNLTASNTNSNHSRRHDTTASNHHVPLPSSSSSNTLNTNRSSGSSRRSQNITHNRLMRKRRHRNIWQRGLIRKKPAHWLSASHSVTSSHQMREKNKTEQTAAASGASSNVNTPKKYIHNTRSSHSSDNQALSSFVSGSLSNGCTTLDKESPAKSTNPPRKRLREECSSGTPRSSFGDDKDPVVNGIVDESLKDKETVNEVEMDVLVATSDEDDIEDEDDDILGESSQDDPQASSVNVTDSNSNAVLPKSSRNKSRLSDSSAANKRQVVINRSSLRKVLNDIIRATDNVSSFELLLDLYDKLKGLINGYIKSYNRTSLPSKLENEVKRFVECCASMNSSKHLSDGHNGSSGSERYNS